MSGDVVDVKRLERHLYLPPTKPGIVDVPEMTFLAVDGEGDPNDSASYAETIEILYGLAYTIKMSKKGDHQPDGYVDFVVPPLEGLWCIDDPATAFDGLALVDKEQLTWTSMLRVPAFVTDDVLAWAKERLGAKKRDLNLDRAYLHTYTEGLCTQIMHIGPYDTEPASVALMDELAAAEGYVTDFENGRRHHEIYLSDPRRVAPEKMKTVVRHPIRPV